MTGNKRMRFDCITLFPEMFSAITGSGITRRALEQGRWQLQLWNPRDFSSDNYRTVDDRPYGGGPGMVMLAEPLEKAIAAAREGAPQAKVIYLSPQGEPLRQDMVKAMLQELMQQGVQDGGKAESADEARLVLLCGRYEGVDERLIERCVDRQVSLGDFVISGGELAAMALIDAVVRQLPGVLNDAQSAEQDTFSDGLLECPQYTRPEQYAGSEVPAVLMSGHHANIVRWRLKQSLGRTAQRRPELLQQRGMNAMERGLLEEFLQEQAQDGKR